MMNMRRIQTTLLLLALSFSCRSAPKAPADEVISLLPTDPTPNETSVDIKNLPELWQATGASNLHDSNDRGQGVKIAVFDNGFLGWEQELGRTLPPETKLIVREGVKPAARNHGLIMARLAYAMASGQNAYNKNLPHPELYLFVTTGYENLQYAVDQAIAMGIDIVLYSQVWEYGGNLDGRGYINTTVNKAVNAGILWVNAAGNFARGLYRGPISSDASGSVTLPHQDQFLRFEIAEEMAQTRITLAWNDFNDSYDSVTNKDLDLVLEDTEGKRIAISNFVQNGDNKTDHFAPHSWEMINVPLRKGTYHLRVKNNSFNFDPSSEMRIGVYGPESTRIIDQVASNTILTPADNAGVLTVGASDSVSSSRGSFSFGGKPEITSISRVQLSDGQAITSTSTAAAIRAGYLAALWSSYGELNRKTALILLNR